MRETYARRVNCCGDVGTSVMKRGSFCDLRLVMTGLGRAAGGRGTVEGYVWDERAIETGGKRSGRRSHLEGTILA